MKKLLIISSLIFSVLSLASCSPSKPLVVGKKFTYKSATVIEVSRPDCFYTSYNPAGATEEEVIKKVKKELLYNGTSTNLTLHLSEKTDLNTIKYKDQAVEPYVLNPTYPSDNILTSNGTYIVTDKEGTEIKFIKINTQLTEYIDHEFSLGSEYYSTSTNGVTLQSYYSTSFVMTKGKYDKDAKTLTTDVLVTYTENHSTYTASYSLLWEEQQ